MSALPTVACMVLYKNELVHLRRIAEKILRVFDQPLFVTNLEGSTDGSEAYLESLGIEPVRIPWQEDFSRARQAGLAASVCDHTLWMDCDDDLITDCGSWESARSELRSQLKASGRAAYWHRVYHADRRTFWQRENLFHRDAAVRVRYPTHEIYEWQGSIGTFPAGVLDRVNAPLKADYPGKHWRYFDMLQRYLREVDPEDCRCHYYLAAEFHGPASAKIALYKDFFAAIRRRPSYRNFPEEWCALYGLFELRAKVAGDDLLALSEELLLRWPFEFLGHFLSALIRCEIAPSVEGAWRLVHVIRGRDRFHAAGSGWFRGWYYDKALNACGYYVHRASVRFDRPDLAEAAVEILSEALRGDPIAEVLPNLKGNLEMARRWREGYGVPSDPAPAQRRSAGDDLR